MIIKHLKKLNLILIIYLIDLNQFGKKKLSNFSNFDTLY